MMIRAIRTALNPFTRTAILAFAWAHRRTILRWGRSFLVELREPTRIDPGRLVLIGKVLFAITRDERLAKSRQLRQVSLDGTTLVVDSTPGWKGTARLVDELGEIRGITAITDRNGNVLAGSIPVAANG